MPSIASSSSPGGWFHCLGRKHEFILKFREVKRTLSLQVFRLPKLCTQITQTNFGFQDVLHDIAFGYFKERGSENCAQPHTQETDRFGLI